MDFGRAISSGVLVAGITAALGFMTGNLNLAVAAIDVWYYGRQCGSGRCGTS